MSVAAGWTLIGLAPAILVLGAVLPPAVAADLAYGEYLASECVTCHSATVGQGAIPAIAGLPAPYFVNALRDYRAGRRLNPVMQNVARSRRADRGAGGVLRFLKGWRTRVMTKGIGRVNSGWRPALPAWRSVRSV